VSRKVQDPALFPWQVDQAVDDGVADLRKFACQLRQEVDNVGLDNQATVGGNSKIEFFNSAKSEILKDETFRSHSRQSTAMVNFDNTIKKVGSDAAVYADKLADQLEHRHNQARPAFPLMFKGRFHAKRSSSEKVSKFLLNSSVIRNWLNRTGILTAKLLRRI
jgi:hypothetical protein